jgi:two-component system sensor histidine kinase RegB
MTGWTGDTVTGENRPGRQSYGRGPLRVRREMSLALRASQSGTGEAAAPRLAAPRRGRVRLRTLVAIRWAAVAGQAAALLVVHYGLMFPLPLVPSLLCVLASAGFNLWVQRGRGRMWLGDRDAALTLAYDLVQLGALIYLTGGLQNPFSVLILAPVTVSATLLSRRSTFWLTGLAVVMVSLLAVSHEPLPWPGSAFRMEPIYVFAAWVALVLAAIFIAAYVWSVAEEARRMSDGLAATQMALDREHRLAALGALAAAAAHELGTPLGTIAVAAKELAREAPKGSALAEDAVLILSQSERCREILARLARRPEMTDPDHPLLHRPLSLIVAAAAEPHRIAAPHVALDIRRTGEPADEPRLEDRPALLHGLGNLVQNALQFAVRRVTVELSWDAREVGILIRDDGPGFPPEILDQIGDPYVSLRYDQGEEKVHMGLGIFIAETLLQRTGALLRFANCAEGGAEVAIRWKRATLEAGSEKEAA